MMKKQKVLSAINKTDRVLKGIRSEIDEGIAINHQHRYRYDRNYGEHFCTICGKWRHQIEGY